MTSRRRRFRPVSDFLRTETAGGLVLLLATATALVWVNSPCAPSYERLWHTALGVGAGPLALPSTLQQWINDGLMVIFFFVVGLEIKRELVVGQLRDPRTAALPVLAAAAGMAVPALLYLAVTHGSAASRGWGVPMATDIAFAVGVLALFAARIPSPVRTFLLTLAIVDDIGAIVVIAVFYSGGIAWPWLLGAVVVFGLIALLRMRVVEPWAYVPLGIAAWLAVYESGISATIAGVVLGLLTPARPVRGRLVLASLEETLHPWSSYLVVPLFALANAGVVLDGAALRAAFTSAVAWGVIIGLVVGKPLGIVLSTAGGRAVGWGRLAPGVHLHDIGYVGSVAGIGFTISLFVAELAFGGQPGTLAEAKIGILAASLLSGILGSLALVAVTRRHHPR